MPRKISARQWFRQPTTEQDMFLFNINQQFWKAINDFGITLPRKYSSVGLVSRDIEHTVTDTYKENGYQIAVCDVKNDLIAGIEFGVTSSGNIIDRSGKNRFSSLDNPIREGGDVGGDLWKLLLTEYGIEFDAGFIEVLVNAVLGFHAYQEFLQFLGEESGLLPRSCMTSTWQAIKIEYRTFKVTGEVFDDSNWFVRNDTNLLTREPAFKQLLENIHWINRT